MNRSAIRRHPLAALGCVAALGIMVAVGADYLGGLESAAPAAAAAPAAPPPAVVGGRIVPSDRGFSAALPSPGRPDRVRRGNRDDVAAFDTVLTPGSLTELPASGDPVRGTFSPVFDWPLIGIHAVLTPDGRVLTYGTSEAGRKTGYFSYDVWDPQLGLGPESHKLLPNETAVDIFCNVQLLLPTGNIEMWGGDTTDVASGGSLLEANDDSNLFNPLDDTLIRTGKMHRKRWYASATTLPDGQVYIQGGSGGDAVDTGGKDYPEVRTATGKFRLLTGASTFYLNSLYPRNFLAPDGKVFGLHYSQMYRVDPTGAGALTRVGKFSKANIGGTSTSVMFAPGRILQVGGGLDDNLASLDAHVIDIRPHLPVITAIDKPRYRRHWGNTTVLPDGRVFLSGGSTADNDARNGVAYTSEIYDPKLNKWAIAATAQRMRLYHSASLLLPDATVLTLGGGALGPELNLNAEIYYPPYLFKADGSPASRPIINSLPMTTDPGKAVRIGTANPSSIQRVTMVKAGSNTHSVDMDQRFLELEFVVDGGDLLAQLPTNKFDTPPGFYLLFLFDQKGVPSEARPMRINVIGAVAEPPAMLTVKKVVVNDDGGSKSAPDFRFSVNGASTVAFESDGSNVLSVPAGTYTVTEPAVAGYAATYSGCNAIALTAGSSATCTITNNDEAAAPPGTGNLLANADFEINSVPDGTRALVSNLAGWSNKAGPIPVWRNGLTPGRNASFIEIEGASGTVNNRIYQNVTTTAGAIYELSFLHSPRPGNSATSNRVDIYWNGTRVLRLLSNEGSGLTNANWQRVNVVVTGTGDSDRVSFFEAGTDTDDRGTLIDDVRLVPQGAGEPEPATLTVRKVVVNNDGGSKSAADFRFSVNGATPVAFESDGSNVLSVPAGTYTVTEPAVAGYAATYSGCNAIALTAGSSATCTITNNDEAAAPPGTGNLLANADFEINSVPDGTRALVSNLAGWSNKAGPIPVWRNGLTPGRNASFIEIEGASGTVNNRIYQNVTTTAGAIYELSFLHSPRPGNSATSNRVDIYWNGTRVLRLLANEGGGLTDTNWQRASIVVTATGADRVSFFEAGTDTDDRGTLIDDVQLVPR